MELKKHTGIAPALTLMVLAPSLTEVLPGATRLSSLFVFPIEICVWGGGALLVRYAVRRWRSGWLSMLLLAIALAIAEECLIQQTSLAPMVIRLKGVTYARELGVNYVYFLWALVYEPVFVVFLPVCLTEMIFPDRRESLWVNKSGLFTVIILFIIGSIAAWFTWTQIARVKVFHLPAYHPPYTAIFTAVAAIGGLIYLALGPSGKMQAGKPPPQKPLPSGWIGITGAVWAIILYGLVLLGFGIAPDFPPLIAVVAGFILFGIVLVSVPRFMGDIRQHSSRTFALIFGIMLGSMLISFLGFIWSGGPDLYFKIIVDILAVALMIVLGSRIKKTAGLTYIHDKSIHL